MTKKILQINVVANSGSTGKITEKIGDLVKKEGWESYIVYGRWARKSNSTLYNIGNKVELIGHGILSLIWDLHGRGSVLATHKLIAYINKIQPNIIHLHNVHGYYINYKILFEFLSKQNIPVVWTLHDCWSYTGHCVHYTAAGCYKWLNGCHDCPNIKDYPRSLRDNSCNNYNSKKRAFTSIKNMTVVTVSEWLKNETKRSFLKKYPVEVISNGIDTETFRPVCSNVREKYGIGKKFMILSVATQWIKRKGLDDFIKLSGIISEDMCIVLVGVTEKQISKFTNNMIGITRTEDVEEMVKLYSTADVYVSFSEEETFGMTIIESMACGTPAIVYNATACKELINENVGYVVNVHDVSAAYQCINKVQMTGKDFYSNHCIEHVRKKYSDKDTFKKYIDLYNKLTDDFDNNSNI